MAETFDAIARPQTTPASTSPAKSHAGESATLRVAIVLIVLAAAVLVGHFTPIRGWLSDVDHLRATLASLGAWVYPVSAIALALMIACGVPRLVLCFVSGAVFGFWIGLPINLAGTMLGHYAVFVFVRWGGRDWAINRWPKLKAWSDLIHENGVAGVVVVRQLPAHAMLLNLALGISHVKHRHFLLGTLLGVLPEAIPATLIGAGIVKASLKDSIGYIGISVAVIAAIWIVCGSILKKMKAEQTSL